MLTSDDDSLYQACFQGDDKDLALTLANPDNVNYVDPYIGNTPLHLACEQGWLDVVQLLIETYGCDSNVTNIYNQSPLDYAIQYDQIDVVSYLQRSSLYWACFQGSDKHLVLKLITPDNVNYVHPSGDTPLHQACRQGWLDVIKLLIEAYGCDSNVTNTFGQSPLDYANQYGNIDVVSYIQRINGFLYWACCQGNKHLVLKLINPDNINYVHPDYGDTPLHQACKRGCLDIVKLLVEENGCDPNITTKSNQSVLHYACQYGHIEIVNYLINKQHLNPLLRDNVDQSEPLDSALNNNQTDIAVYLCQHCISSDEMLNPNRIKTTINLIRYISRDRPFNPWPYVALPRNEVNPFSGWKTTTGDNILQLVGGSKACISHIPSAIMLKILNFSNAAEYITVKPDCKTSDGDNMLELVCQSEIFLSQTPSALILKWLCDTTTINQVKKSIPNSKTADGDPLIQLVCQSEICISHVSTGVLSKWLNHSTIIRNLAALLEIITPEWKTADGDTLLQLLCQSKTTLSRISSTVLTKWLTDSTITLNFTKAIIAPDLRTADGVTLFQLICQSEKCLTQISSTVFLKWVRKTPLRFVNTSIPDCKLADGYTLLQLILQSMSRISSNVLFKLVNDSKEVTIDQMRAVEPNWKTLDHVHFLYILFHSKVEDMKIIELMQHYILKSGLNLDNTFLDSEGNTVLHIACEANKHALVSYLIDQAHCDPNIKNKSGSMPLQLTSDSEIIRTLVDHGAKMTTDVVFKLISSKHVTDSGAIELFTLSVRKGTMLWNPNDLNNDGCTALHLACQANKLAIVSYLINQAHCDLNIKNLKGNLPLDMTTDPEVIDYLCQHDHVAVYSKTIIKWINKRWLIDDATMLRILKSLVDNHIYKTEDGSTLLHAVCRCTHTRFHAISTLIDFLLTEGHCDPNCLDSKGQMPLQITSSLKIVTKLIEHGARMTAGDVFKLIMSYKIDSAINKILSLSIKKQAILWNPNELNGDGYTALHLACKADNPSTVNLLLSEAHCDPNFKSNNEEVPLQMTTNPDIIKDLIRHGAKTSIMYESYHKSLGTNKPLQPPVKIFIVGNFFVGKSTLTAALKKKIGFIARILSGKVSGVDRKTVGIVPHDIESEIFGRVTLYDFAGQREFYSGHAALLQTAIQSTPPVFLLVVNVCEDSDEIIKTILYWISFLENQCASVSCRPHIILVGSHADALKGINPKDKIEAIIGSLDTEKYFTNMEYIGFVALNCQYHESTGMTDLRRLLIRSCQELRIHEPITFNAHCFLVFLIDTFMNQTAVTIKTISERIENQQSKEGVLEFLSESIETLYKICLELNDRGHILLLKDRFAVENSYIVIDKEFLLSKLSGTVFAPEGFKQYKELSTNTGVVPLSKIAETFPDQDLSILIGLLTHLEFCHEISDESLHQLISEQYSLVPHERYYLFPGLISMKADDTIWQVQLTEYDYRFGWILKCIHLEQFFSSRFLQVLLLRLAFSFALKVSCDNHNRSIGIHRNCFIWKNGIFWGRTFAMQTLVEVTPDNKSVLLLARFQGDDLLQCVQHRSEIISTILQCKEQFCPRVQTMEVFLDSSSPHQYPINLPNESNICTLQELATAVVSDSKSRRVVLQFSTISAKTFVSFEPYLEMKVSTIQELWDEKKEKKIISETFITKFVQKATDKLSSLIKTLTESSMSSTSEDQLYQDLLRWRDSGKTNKRTYKDLRQLVDQYSVFAGRNVLELTCTKLLRPMEDEEQKQQEQGEVKQEVKEHLKIQEEEKVEGNDDDEDEKPQCKLRVHGNKPKLHQLQLLNFPDKTELRIIEKVAPKWKQVAVVLGFDGARIETMEMGALRQPEDASLKMFTGWLEGGHDLQPPTWDVLIQSIRSVKLTEIADLLSKTIEIEADDTSASNTLSTTAVDTESRVASSTATPDIINRITNNKATAKSSKFENSVSPLNIEDELTELSQADVQGPRTATMLNIKVLEEIEGRGGGKIRVIESIGCQWEEVAKALDMGQEDIDMIKTKRSDNDEEACCEMLATWLEGNNSEISWTAFSQALIDAGLPELADNLKDVLGL